MAYPLVNRVLRELVGNAEPDHVTAWVDTLIEDERKQMTLREAKEPTTQVAFRLPDKTSRVSTVTPND